MAIYAHARVFMAQSGNPTQWGTTKPHRWQIENDIAEGVSHVVVDDGGEILAVFFFRIAPDPTYETIYDGAWLNDAPYGVIHRIAAAQSGSGAAKFAVEWCLEQVGDVRIDTHANNLPMQKLLAKCGFSRCGIIYIEDGTQRIAYQKSRTN